MSKQILLVITLVFLSLFRTEARAENYRYSQLMALTYDEMMSEVKKRVQAAEQVESDEAEAKAKLKDALEMVLSRPDRDNMVYQLVPIIRTPLKNYEAFEPTMIEIADKAMKTLKKTNAKPSDQATAVFVLTNIMSEMKPDLKTNKKVQKLFANIRDAKIEISKKVNSEVTLNAMTSRLESPSILAERILQPAK